MGAPSKLPPAYLMAPETAAIIASTSSTTLLPVGRPSVYDPRFCDVVENMGREGRSIANMASHIGVARKTIYEWEEQHAEFRDALSRAREHSQSWWELHAQDNLNAKHYQAQLWRYSMQGRFEDYAEKKQIDVNVTLRDALVASSPLTIEGEASCAPVVAQPKAKATKAKDIKDIAEG